MTSLEFRDRLVRRARRARASLKLEMLGPLELYFRLLSQWNAKINLTAFPMDTPTDEAFDRLLVEPLVAARQFPSDTRGAWVDLGSGGGSPAIPLKIARPLLSLTMIESKERKSAFLREAVRLLGLADTTVETERFEVASQNVAHSATADLVTVRAVRADSVLFETAERMLRDGGRLLLFRPPHSASADPPGFERQDTIQLMETPPTFLSVYRHVSRGTREAS